MAGPRPHVHSIWTITVPSLWTVIVFFMHVIHVDPHSVSRFKIPHADKVVHFTLFLVLAFLWTRAQRYFNPHSKRSAVFFILVICASYGGMLEWLQSQLGSNRMSDWKDWIADVLGTCTGAWLAGKKILSVLFGHQVGEAH
jgi:VanZ family protein